MVTDGEVHLIYRDCHSLYVNYEVRGRAQILLPRTLSASGSILYCTLLDPPKTTNDVDGDKTTFCVGDPFITLFGSRFLEDYI